MAIKSGDWQAPRPFRSLLMVPGSRPEFFAKAAAGPADAICLDLEDSVSPAEKDKARAQVAQALREVDWGDRHIVCRINPLDTGWWYRDVIALVEQGGTRLDSLMLPKAESAADIHAVDMLALAAAANAGRAPLGIEFQAESARGVLRLEEMAGASPRNAAIHFGHADFAASMGMRTTEIGTDSADYAVAGEGGPHPGDAWHYPMAHVVMAARSHGLLPIAGPYGRHADIAGLQVIARRNAYAGFAGKWAIHPGQVATINAAFAPSPAEIARARALLAAAQAGEAAGHGAVSHDGVLVDAVSIRQARHLLALGGDG